MPLEVFLISLSACLGGSISLLLKKMNIIINGLSIKATGQRRDVHPTYFEKINLFINLKSPNATDESMKKALEISEKQICPVLAMINEKVAINYDWIIEA